MEDTGVAINSSPAVATGGDPGCDRVRCRRPGHRRPGGTSGRDRRHGVRVRDEGNAGSRPLDVRRRSGTRSARHRRRSGSTRPCTSVARAIGSEPPDECPRVVNDGGGTLRNLRRSTTRRACCADGALDAPAPGQRSGDRGARRAAPGATTPASRIAWRIETSRAERVLEDPRRRVVADHRRERRHHRRRSLGVLAAAGAIRRDAARRTSRRAPRRRCRGSRCSPAGRRRSPASSR